MKKVAVVFAGGVGQRMGVKDVPKQFLEVDGKPVIIYTLEHFQNHEEIDEVYVVCVKEWIDYLNYQLEKYGMTKVKSVVPGGVTGQDSIYIGLKEAEKNCTKDDIVLIHDGVRPFITADLISRNIHDTIAHGNSITCTGCNETFITSKDALNVDGVPVRRESFNAQAPQAFRLGEIIEAHEQMRAVNPDYIDVIDSCTLFNMQGRPTYLTEGVRGNTKITNPVDIYIFQAWKQFKQNGEAVVGIPDLSEYYTARGLTAEGRKVNSVIQNDMAEVIKDCRHIDALRNQTILITGATGLIAKNLVYFFLELNKKENTNIKVLALVRNLDKAKKAFAEYEGDENLVFLNQDVCTPINYEGEIDYIFHAAGSASAHAIKTNPTGIIQANTMGTMNVLELARIKNVKKVIFPSTREIYGKVEGKDLISEEDMGLIDPMDGRNCYPESKRLAEAMFRSYNNQYGVPFNILRIAHTYGPGMELVNDGRVMADFMEAAVNSKDIILNSDGTARRSFCYVSDTIAGILDVMVLAPSGEAYNLANEKEPQMIRDVAQMIIDLYPEKDMHLQFANPSDEVKKGYVSYKIVQLNTSKIEELGWNPKVRLKDGLKRTVEFFEEDKKAKQKRL